MASVINLTLVVIISITMMFTKIVTIKLIMVVITITSPKVLRQHIAGLAQSEPCTVHTHCQAALHHAIKNPKQQTIQGKVKGLLCLRPVLPLFSHNFHNCRFI